MKKQEPQYERNRARITTIADGKVEHFPSIALAKKASRKLQMANGGLGSGVLVAIRSVNKRKSDRTKPTHSSAHRV